MNEVNNFIERQQEIDRLLTSSIVQSILSENWDTISTGLDKNKRFITILYSSTQSLLRKLTQKQDEEPIDIVYKSIDDIPQSSINKTILTCKSLPSSICISIGTYLPTSIITSKNDSIYTHTFTCINNILT